MVKNRPPPPPKKIQLDYGTRPRASSPARQQAKVRVVRAALRLVAEYLKQRTEERRNKRAEGIFQA